MKNIVIPFLVLLFVALGCGTDTKTANTPPVNTNEPPIVVKADALTKAYDANEIAADGQYKNRMLEVSGTITGITETLGLIQVDLEGHKDANGLNFITVKCTFNEDQKQAVGKLTKGAATALIGRSEGMTAGLYVGLNECRIK